MQHFDSVIIITVVHEVSIILDLNLYSLTNMFQIFHLLKQFYWIVSQTLFDFYHIFDCLLVLCVVVRTSDALKLFSLRFELEGFCWMEGSFININKIEWKFKFVALLIPNVSELNGVYVDFVALRKVQWKSECILLQNPFWSFRLIDGIPSDHFAIEACQTHGHCFYGYFA